MSVVVYKDGVLAADSKAYGGKYQTSPGSKRKAHLLADGSRVGVIASVIGMPERFVEWLKAGADPDAWGVDPKPDLRALLIKPNGEVFLYDDGLHPSGPIECDSYAIGSGAEFALGAIAMGADAVRAVQIACALDHNCGGPVTVLHAEADDGA